MADNQIITVSAATTDQSSGFLRATKRACIGLFGLRLALCRVSQAGTEHVSNLQFGPEPDGASEAPGDPRFARYDRDTSIPRYWRGAHFSLNVGGLFNSTPVIRPISYSRSPAHQLCNQFQPEIWYRAQGFATATPDSGRAANHRLCYCHRHVCDYLSE